MRSPPRPIRLRGHLPSQKGPGTPGAEDTAQRERTRPEKNHKGLEPHVLHNLPHPRTRSPVRLVRRPGGGRAGRKRPCHPRLRLRIPCLPGEQLRLQGRGSRTEPESYINGPIRTGPPPDVPWNRHHVPRNTSCTWLILGAARIPHSANSPGLQDHE